MSLVVQEAVTSYNQDVNELGVSPCQAALGRQPRMQGDVLGGAGLAEAGLLDAKPSLARQIALREVAKVAMARLHFSQGLRRALMARSRTSTLTQDLHPGQVVYYFRQSKYNNRTEPSKRKLSLKRWHGPALLIAFDGQASCFVSHRGQLCKCALEHVRPASMMEQVAAGVWRDAIEDVVEAAIQDISNKGVPPAEVQPSAQVQDAPPDLPPVQPQELVHAAVSSGEPSEVPQQFDSRRTSLLSSAPRASGAAPGTPVGGLLQRNRPFTEALQRARSFSDAAGGANVPLPGDDDSVGFGGQKREAEVPLEQLQQQAASTQLSEPGGESPVEELQSYATSTQPNTFEAMEALTEPDAQGNGVPHPLRRICGEVMEDRKNPLDHIVTDHGTWRGTWPMPSRSDWQAVSCVGWTGPKGDNEVHAVQTARKEYFWKNMSAEDKVHYKQAAANGWKVWVDNQALEVLEPGEAKRTWSRLKATGSLHKVLRPRFVYTDKHDGLRTHTHPLPLKANARLVVPGYKDVTAYEVRKDAPTGTRISQHLVLTWTASKRWRLKAADIKSAFLKGEEFAPGERELYIANIRTICDDEPDLPLGEGGLARLRKGIFGLSDSPRRWYLRLHKSLCKLGWVRSEIDPALWFLWNHQHDEIIGMVLSHVDDLLFGGNDVAAASLDQLGSELGFGSMEEGQFVYCGKQFTQHEDFSISISMEAYHENLQLVKIPLERRRNPEAFLTPSEQKSLRGVLGSLQWLVAQLRVDQSYPLSVLQGEEARVSTLLKANALVKKFKQDSKFRLVFKPMKLEGCGLIAVSDASLGNVLKSGGVGQEPMMRVYSQSAFVILIADADLMAGREGQFCFLDGRSHRLSRVCRSTYAAELLSAEEAVDNGQYCRGVLAEAFGYPMNARDPSQSLEQIGLTIVTDAKDVYDKTTSDTPSYGSQKSLAFSVSWLRNVLRQPGVSIRWTATSNMIVDCMTKEMDGAHLRKILQDGKWCARYSPLFVKQTVKVKRSNSSPVEKVEVGKLLTFEDPMLSRLINLSDAPGWHRREGVPIHVALDAKSFRSPEPRFDSEEFDLRSSFGRFDKADGNSEWRELEDNVKYRNLRQGSHGLIGQSCAVLVTFFRSSQTNKEGESAVESSNCLG